ncbi:MAG: hypothetical protein VKK04_16040 [Synechococcales bacterium]|nr:hypothetical protein [Synechococcales bacterium]
MTDALDQAVQYLTGTAPRPPAAPALVAALEQAEKAARQLKVPCTYDQLVGTWRLRFITGTKRSRQQAGGLLGAGRFLPSWLAIQITYTSTPPHQDAQMAAFLTEFQGGTVQNTVRLAGLCLEVAGPTRLWPGTHILAFDFPRLALSVAGLSLYQGYIPQGKDRETRFYNQPLKEQAFFNYFLIEDTHLAARGRGGGLALWVRAWP